MPAKKAAPTGKKTTSAKKATPARKTTPAKKATPSTKVTPAKKSTPAKKTIPAPKKSKLAEIKTKPTGDSVEDFINKVPDEQKRKDSGVILEMMKKATGEEPKLWGSSIIGFGDKRYKSPTSGREVDWFLIGFAPRKANISLYLTMDINKHAEALQKLGKHKTGVGCLYINKLDDIDTNVLKGLITTSLKKK